MTTLPSIFISYSRTDSVFVDKLEAELSKYGFVTWVDRHHLKAGDDWAPVIQEQINCHDLMIVILSPAAIESEWVEKEIATAQQSGKEIIPVLHKKTLVPIRIVTLQFIDMIDFSSGIVQLRAALSKPRVNPPPLQKQSSDYAPPPSLRQDILVDIPTPPPTQPLELEVMYMQARSAFARGDWDTADALFQQVVTKDSNYDRGAAKSDAAIAHKNLIPVQINRLQTKADAAHNAGQWGEEIACWKAVLGLASQHQEANKRLSIAEQNQRAEGIYKRAVTFAKARDVIAARSEIERLQKEAPYYGDSERLGPYIGVIMGSNYIRYQEQVQQQQLLELQQREQQELVRLSREQLQKPRLQPVDQEIFELQKKIWEIEQKEFRLSATFTGITPIHTFSVILFLWVPLFDYIGCMCAFLTKTENAPISIIFGSFSLLIACLGFTVSFIYVKFKFDSFKYNEQLLGNYLTNKRNNSTWKLRLRLEKLYQKRATILNAELIPRRPKWFFQKARVQS